MSKLKETINLFFLIDALGWEWIKDSDFLKSVSAVRSPLKTVLGFSCSAIPSILTGKYPSEHGRWNLLYYNPETSPFAWTKYLHMFPESLLESKVGRKIINVVSKKISGSEGYFSSYGLSAKQLYLFDISEKNNIYKPEGVSGSRTIIDYLDQNRIKHVVYSYHDHTDSDILDTMVLDTNKESNVLFAYLAEMDSFLHSHCNDRDLVEDKLAWYEDKILSVIAAAGKCYQDVRWFIFSDHGMTPIVKHYDLIGDLKKGGIDLRKDCLAVFDSTMARFWVKNSIVIEKLMGILANCPEGRVLGKQDLEDLKIYFSDSRYGEVIFLMNPGVLIYPNLFGKYAPKGMHGFHPDDPYSYGSYLSNVDAYSPSHITDLLALMKSEVRQYQS